MTRTAAREIAVHFSFELGFAQTEAKELLNSRLQEEVFSRLAEETPLYSEFPNIKQQEYIRTLVSGVGEHGVELDAYIEKYAVGRRFSRISRVAAAIMRIAMYELLYMPEIPAATAINEAVELSKNYEEPETSAFINGILGSFVRTECGFLRPEASETRAPVKKGTDETTIPACAEKDSAGTVSEIGQVASWVETDAPASEEDNKDQNTETAVSVSDNSAEPAEKLKQ